ncbi:polysaccharide pyruvyl transferase family protein [Rubritalea spongiae]|uniref:Polysaccharide pyruvyl transferase family protein n=1 Tax=Rubritalea spongiae TaxID=430797 RepID=A0ABW5E576_9BACT
MKAILLNDTRSDMHIGCELVVSNTFRLCEQFNIRIISTITTKLSAQAPNIIEPLLKDADIVLLNGEGTIHHDRPKAIALLEAVKLAKERGLLTVLYNALWSDNVLANTYLRYFDLIFCRDSLSTDTIKKQTPSAPVIFVPDMSFITPIPAKREVRNGIMVSDSINKKTSKRLAKFAIKHQATFSPMGCNFFHAFRKKYITLFSLRSLCSLDKSYSETPERFINRLLTSEKIITGRFHTACLAILCGTPVCSISSNTKKIEALYKDFGLTPSLIPHHFPSEDEMNLQWDEQQAKRLLLEQHVQSAQEKIISMFKNISQLIPTERETL